jgi:hypothetical protein
MCTCVVIAQDDGCSRAQPRVHGNAMARTVLLPKVDIAGFWVCAVKARVWLVRAQCCVVWRRTLVRLLPAIRAVSSARR